MGLMDEIIRAHLNVAFQPVREHLQKQFQEMHEQTQRVALVQCVMEHEYELQCYREKEQSDFEEGLRCWFKRNI